MTDSDKNIMLALGRLEGKVDALMAQHGRHQLDMDLLDERVRHLEKYKAQLLGVCAAIASAASYLISSIT
jgi:hypothetical protein